jgi:hypothetical protein
VTSVPGQTSAPVATPVVSLSGAEVVMDRYVRTIRRRLAARIALTGAAVSAFAALALVVAWLAGAVGSVGGSAPLGLLMAKVTGSLLAVGVAVGLFRLWLRSPRGVIRRLRRVDAALAEDLWSGLELREHPTASGPERAFVSCHGESVAQRLGRVSPREVVSFKWLGQASWVLCLGWVFAGLAVVTLPGTAPRLLAALGGHGGPDRLPQVERGSGVSNVRLVIHPPRYTGLPLEVVVPDKAPVSVVTGSRVTVVAKAPEPVVWARALVPGGKMIAATPLGERIFRVELVVRGSGSVVFVYRTARGVLHVGETGPRLTLRPDLPPDPSTQPNQEKIDLPRPTVWPLRYEITDDYGLLEARLVWKTDLGDEGAIVLDRGPRFGAKRKRRMVGVLKWDLTRLGLRRDQSVRFHLEARDNRSGALAGGDRSQGSQTRRTREQTLTISGPRPAQLRVLFRLRKLLERSTGRLADRLENPRTLPCDKRLAAWKRARGTEPKLAADLARLIGQVRNQSGVRALLKGAVTGPLSRALAGLRVALAADRVAAAGLSKGRLEACAGVRTLEINHPRVVKGFEALVLDLDQLIGRATLEQMQRLGQRIARLQKEIDSLQAALKKSPSAELRRRIARRMGRLRRLFDRLGELWATLQDDALDQHVNRYALDRKRTRKLLDRLASKTGRREPAQADLDQLRQRVKRLKKALDRGLDSFRKYYPLPGERGVQRDVQDIRRLAEAQAKVNRQRGGQRPERGGGARRQQQRLSREAGRLGRSMRSRSGRQGVARLVEEASRQMRQAAASKGKGAAQKGKAAKDSLDQAAREMGRQGRLTQGNGEDGRGASKTDDVSIPPAGRALPRKLRQRILEGGRTAWPRGFRRPLKRYYERLLR